MTTLQTQGVGEELSTTTAWRWAWLGVLLLPMVFGGALMWVGPRISADSASYLECAGNITRGNGFLAGLFDGLDPQRWRAMSLWPPGYPLMVAGGMKLGLSAPVAGMVVAAGSTLAALAMIAGWFASRFPARVALPLVLIFAAMAGLARYFSMCWADGPYLALTVASFLLMVRSLRTEKAVLWWAAMSGVLAGFAWCVRNVGLSLIGAIGLFLVLQLLLAQSGRRGVVRLAAWGAGVAVGGGWLAWHNISTFGKLSPYSMAPSNLGPVHNTLYTAYVVLKDFFVLPVAALKTDGVALVIGAAGLLMALILVWRVAPRALAGGIRKSLTRAVALHDEATLVAMYALAYTAMIIVARSVYRWGEPISERYMVQAYWGGLFLVGCFVASRPIQKGREGQEVRRRWITGLYAVLALQLAWNVVYVGYFARQLGDRVQTRAVARSLLNQVKDGQIVLSDGYNVLRGYGGINARSLVEDPEDWPMYQQDKFISACAAGQVWGVAIGNVAKARAGTYGPMIQQLVSDPASLGFVAQQGYGDWAVVAWAGASGSLAPQRAEVKGR